MKSSRRISIFLEHLREVTVAYTKTDFVKLRSSLREKLIGEDNEPLSCQLYDAPSSKGSLSLEFEDGSSELFHVAEACNIAKVIASVDRILSLPRSNIACEELSEVLLLRLDVLREYVETTFKNTHGGQYKQTEADKVIRRWAGFLKHPCDYVFAHRCSPWELEFDEPTIEINCDFLASWDTFNSKVRDEKKSELANQAVSVTLPETLKLDAFFHSTADHLRKLIALNSIESCYLEDQHLAAEK